MKSWFGVVFLFLLGFTIAIQTFGYVLTSDDPTGATICSFVAV